MRKTILNALLAAALAIAGAPAMAASGTLGDLLDSVPFGARAKTLVKSGAAKDIDEEETCRLPGVKRFYREHDMSCRWLLMKEPYVVAGVPFHAVLITDDDERVVALSLRRAHQFASAQRPEEMTEPSLQRSSEDRDHMLARNELYVELGAIAEAVGRDSISERAGLRAVDHYFRGVKYHAVFNERLTPRLDHFVISIFPSNLGEPNRSVFVPFGAHKKYFGGVR